MMAITLLLLNYPISELVVLNILGHVEPPFKESNDIRNILSRFGIGRNTSLGIVMSASGENRFSSSILFAASVRMFTITKTTTVKIYLSVKSQRKFLEFEIKIEEYKIETSEVRLGIEKNYCIKEFDDLISGTIEKMMSNKEVWLITTLTEEVVPDNDIIVSPFKVALIMCTLFIIGKIMQVILCSPSKIRSLPLQFSLRIAIGNSNTPLMIGVKKTNLVNRKRGEGRIEMSDGGTGLFLLRCSTVNEFDHSNLLDF